MFDNDNRKAVLIEILTILLSALVLASLNLGCRGFASPTSNRRSSNSRLATEQRHRWGSRVGSSALLSVAPGKEHTVQVTSEAGVNRSDCDSDLANESTNAFELLAGNVANCLVLSDLKRQTGNDGASTGWTSWVDEASSFRLKSCIDSLCLATLNNPQDPNRVKLLEARDEILRWTKWMKSCPSPMILELAPELRLAVNATIGDPILKTIDSTRDEFLARIGCRLVLLPSGSELQHTLQTPPGAMAHGKLLYGGAKRYRLIGKQRRRVGERVQVYSSTAKSWLQYGGPDRNYEAVDMGPCALVEVILLPKGLSLSLFSREGDEMTLGQIRWHPTHMFGLVQENETKPEIIDISKGGPDIVDDTTGKDHVDVFESSFTSNVGGLQTQIQAIVRRVLDGRVVQPVSGTSETHKGNPESRKKQLKEAETLTALGLEPVRGLLLYGPPGCGKTALAREISRSLNAHRPKIIAAPELLDRWVGGSEKLVRELFADAEAELRRNNGDATKCSLHVIVIDEIDAVFRRRTTGEDSGLVSRDSCVNQILAKLDGVNALGNVLVIGMTNRRELLDDALLRPGRLEVQVKIPYPDREGRREILQIHFEALRRRGRLSKPLCQAIEGAQRGSGRPKKFWKSRTKLASSLAVGRRSAIRDLASSHWTGGFSGADIAGLVRCAGSIALARARTEGGGIDSLLITVEDVIAALDEVKR